MDAKIRNFSFSKNQWPIYFILGVLALSYFWDLGNINAIRQGTEGFYLQLSKEMFEKQSFLTPSYFNDPHWSKPPLQFWLAQPFYFLAGDPSLGMARLCVLLVTLAGLVYLAKWARRNLSLDALSIFLLFASSFGILKFARIYMMEIPLMLLTCCGTLLYYEYLQLNQKKYLVFSILTLGLSVLIKGPVSLAMAFPAIGAYLIYKTKLKTITPFGSFITLVVGAILVGSLWFLASYWVHGYKFIHNFFIRENLGKFTAKNYPAKVLFQGILMFSLPWCLWAYYWFRPRKIWNQLTMGQRDGLIFLGLNFVFSFFLWLIPKQKSHHYAMPALPYFLLILGIGQIFGPKVWPEKITQRINIGFKWLILALVFIIYGTTLVGSPLANSNKIRVVVLTILGIFFVILGIFASRKRPELKKYLFYSAPGLIIGHIWFFIAPSFFLPLVSNFAIDKVAQAKRVGVIYRRPYYIAETLNKDIKALDPGEFLAHFSKNSQFFYILQRKVFNHYLEPNQARVIAAWPVWKRGRSFGEILQAVKNNDPESLQEEMILIQSPQN